VGEVSTGITALTGSEVCILFGIIKFGIHVKCTLLTRAVLTQI
jgi:hypothetical protein